MVLAREAEVRTDSCELKTTRKRVIANKWHHRGRRHVRPKGEATVPSQTRRRTTSRIKTQETIAHHRRIRTLDVKRVTRGIYLRLTRPQGMRNPEEEAQSIADIATQYYDDEYVRDTFCDISLSL